MGKIQLWSDDTTFWMMKIYTRQDVAPLIALGSLECSCCVEKARPGKESCVWETLNRETAIWIGGICFDESLCHTKGIGGVSPQFLKAVPESTLRLSTLAVQACLFTAWSDRNAWCTTGKKQDFIILLSQSYLGYGIPTWGAGSPCK